MAVTLRTTGTIRLFGGQMDVALGVSCVMTGAVVSRIVKVPEADEARRNRDGSPANSTLTGNTPSAGVINTLATPDAFVTPVAVVTPKAVSPVVIWLFGVVWLFWLRVGLLILLTMFGATPKVS